MVFFLCIVLEELLVNKAAVKQRCQIALVIHHLQKLWNLLPMLMAGFLIKLTSISRSKPGFKFSNDIVSQFLWIFKGASVFICLIFNLFNRFNSYVFNLLNSCVNTSMLTFFLFAFAVVKNSYTFILLWTFSRDFYFIFTLDKLLNNHRRFTLVSPRATLSFMIRSPLWITDGSSHPWQCSLVFGGIWK